MDQSILDLDATALAMKIKTGELSAKKAAATYIDHLRKVNTVLNMVVEERYERALQEAEECDRMIAEGRAEGKLLGVPISMKESFDVAGMKTTGGLRHRKEHVAAEDAKIVARLRQAGAIILAKTNTPTLCFCQETENKLYGRTNNPWDPTRSAGGSSGGEGVMIAVGGAAVGIGSDIGGSIRFPAHFNGVIGFKSGSHQVSQSGHFPYADHPLQARMLGIGALAKSVDDAKLINGIISDEPSVEQSLSSFTISIPPAHPHFPVDSETASQIHQVKEIVSREHRATSDFPPMFEKLAHLWQLIMSVDGGESIARLALGDRSPLTEYIKETIWQSSDIHRYLTWAVIGARLFRPRGKQLEELQETLTRLDHAAETFFRDTILVLPVYHSPALPHGQLYKEIFSVKKTFLRYMPYVSVANVLGLPALVIPVGVSSNGLPISVQLISAAGNEQALFQLGKIIEVQLRGYKRCTNYDKKMEGET